MSSKLTDQRDFPFSKIEALNGILYHHDEHAVMAMTDSDLLIAPNDSVEFNSEVKYGFSLSQIGKIVGLFFLESSRKIIAQIERKDDKKMVSVELGEISQRF